MKIEGIEFLGVEVVFDCIIPFGSINLGAVYLKCENRSFVLDTIRTRYNNDNNHTTLEIELEVGIGGDTDFDSCESHFDLTQLDLFTKNTKGTLWCEGNESDVEPDSITLFYRSGGENGCTTALELELE